MGRRRRRPSDAPPPETGEIETQENTPTPQSEEVSVVCSPEVTSEPDPEPEDDHTIYRTLAHGELSPRHRRLALLAAQGRSNAEICAELGYSSSRVSILRSNPYIKEEIARLTERIYEETVGSRLKSFSEPALNVLERALTDRTGRVKESEKIDVAKWVIEKIDGKAVQKIDAGGSLLSSLMDRLDAQRSRPSLTQVTVNNYAAPPVADGKETLDVTPRTPARLEAGAAVVPSPSEEDELSDWITDFDSGS